MSYKYSKIKKKLKYNKIFDLKGKFINILMRKGQKSSAENITLKCFKTFLKSKTSKNLDPNQILKAALKNISPIVNVKLTRRGRKKVPMPYFLKKDLRILFAIRLLIAISKNSSQFVISNHLCNELISSSGVNASSALSSKCLEKKRQIYQLAQLNKAFAHYRWF